MSITSLAQLKKNKESAFAKLTKAIESVNTASSGNKDDDKYWKPEVDKVGNGYAVVRLMPAPQGEDVPFVRIYDHGFKGPSGKWYIEKSLTTIGKEDPVGKYNSELWNSTTDDESPARKQVRTQKRRLSYIANVYVVKDPANPANEGKVFLWKFGKKLFDKINAAMYPEFEDEQPMNPFDLWDGANFKIKIRQVEGYRNYDKSEFDAPCALLNDDEELEKAWNSCHSIAELVDPKNFKSYEELETRLNEVLDLKKQKAEQAAARAASTPRAEYTPPKSAEAPAPRAKVDEDTDVDPDLEYFQGLVDKD